jgi:DNA-binding response OmpR family regulator
MQHTVLVVEDEYLIALDLQYTLESHGWRVIGPVGTVADALALLEGELPSVGLLDVNLGGELVTPVAIALQGKGVPFAVASAYETPEQHGGPALAGAPNVGKPTNKRRLLETLKQILSL